MENTPITITNENENTVSSSSEPNETILNTHSAAASAMALMMAARFDVKESRTTKAMTGTMPIQKRLASMPLLRYFRLAVGPEPLYCLFDECPVLISGGKVETDAQTVKRFVGAALQSKTETRVEPGQTAMGL